MEVNTSVDPEADSNGNGLPDAWETANGVDDPNADEEPDGLTNIQEYQNETAPNDADSDDDGLNDGPEVNTHMTAPNNDDSDDDSDDDGLTDGAEVNIHMSDPNSDDSDGDGLTDGEEINTHGTNPNENDSDMDGYSDKVEIDEGSDPTMASSIPGNVALSSTGIAGNHNEANDLTTLGIPYFHHGNGVIIPDGTTPRLTDGVTEAITLVTTVDTWHSGPADTHSYVGVIWDTNPAPADTINAISVSMATFVDGGWFGINSATPPGNSPLVLDTHISTDTVPDVQVTSDGGTTWTDVDSTSDYLTQMDGHIIGNPPTTQTVTWTLATHSHQPKSSNNLSSSDLRFRD